jgi:hypothetical protein
LPAKTTTETEIKTQNITLPPKTETKTETYNNTLTETLPAETQTIEVDNPRLAKEILKLETELQKAQEHNELLLQGTTNLYHEWQGQSNRITNLNTELATTYNNLTLAEKESQDYQNQVIDLSKRPSIIDHEKLKNLTVEQSQKIAELNNSNNQTIIRTLPAETLTEKTTVKE